MKKLVIDLGHGGYDPGAVGKNGTKESEVVLSIGKYLDTMLKGIDLDVRFTRMSDRYVSLSDRVKFANSCGADYFLSIHINAATDTSVRGVEIWQYSDNDKKLSDFSSGLCSDIAGIFNVRNRGVKLSKSLYVLNNTFMKSALLEVDFISNISCERDLGDDVYVKNVATAIRDGILKLYNIIPPTSTIYKVCIGSYKDKSNAIAAMNTAKIKGFSDAYII